MTTESICPLCQRGATARNLEKYDGKRVTCQTCGTYDILGIHDNIGIEKYTEAHRVEVVEIAYLLSGLARQASEAGNRLVIDDDISNLLDSIVIPQSYLEKMDRALIYLSERQPRADQHFQVTFDDDYPLVFARDGDEFRYFLDISVGRGLLEKPGAQLRRANESYGLTPEGWEKVEQIKKNQIDSNQAFVAMWFSDKLVNAWEEGFEPALTSTKYNPVRVDLAEYNGKIDDHIVAQIRKSGLMVADFTGNRGGVYFESGFALGLGIPVIWTCRDTDIEQLHFDTRQFNHIVWKNPQDLRARLQNRIAATIPGRAILA